MSENFFFHSCDYNTFSFYILRMWWGSRNDAEASCPKFHRTSCQLQNIVNSQMKIMINSMWCSIVKMTLRHKKHVEISRRFQAILLCLDWKKKFKLFVICSINETFLWKILLSYIAAHQSKLIFLFNWVWISFFMQLNVVWQLAPVTGKVVTGVLPL